MNVGNDCGGEAGKDGQEMKRTRKKVGEKGLGKVREGFEGAVERDGSGKNEIERDAITYMSRGN